MKGITHPALGRAPRNGSASFGLEPEGGLILDHAHAFPVVDEYRPVVIAHRREPDGSATALAGLEIEQFEISATRREPSEIDRTWSGIVDALMHLGVEREFWFVLTGRAPNESDAVFLRTGWVAVGRGGGCGEAGRNAHDALCDLFAIQRSYIEFATLRPVTDAPALMDLIRPAAAPFVRSLRRGRWEPPTRVNLGEPPTNGKHLLRPGSILPWKPAGLPWTPLAEAIAACPGGAGLVVRIRTCVQPPSGARAAAEEDFRGVILEREALRDGRVDKVAAILSIEPGARDPLLTAAAERVRTLRERCLAVDASLTCGEPIGEGLAAVATAALVAPSHAHPCGDAPSTPVIPVDLPGGTLWQPLDVGACPELLVGPREAPALVRTVEPPSDERSSLPCSRTRWMPTRVIAREGAPLGHAEQRGRSVEFRIPDHDRFRHVYVVGQTGTGKSTALLHMILHDVRRGHGVTVLDPHGSLIEETLARIPPDRERDVILIDPSEGERQVGLNPLHLEAESPDEYVALRDRVIDELFDTFESLYDMRQMGGPIFEKYFRFFTSLVTSGSRPKDYAPILPMVEVAMTEPALIDVLAKRLGEHDPTTRSAANVILKATGEGSLTNMTPYVISKLNRLWGPAAARRTLCQPESLNFGEIVDHRRILLAHLSPALLGREAAALIARQIIVRLASALMTKRATGGSRPHFLFADEFHEYASERFAQMLSQVRKYRLGLVLAHQYTSQLVRHGNTQVLDAVLGNVGTTVAFRVGTNDAGLLERAMGPRVTATDISGLPNYQAFVRTTGDFGAETLSVRTRPAPDETTGIASAIRERSSLCYGRPRSLVDLEMANAIAAFRQLKESK